MKTKTKIIAALLVLGSAGAMLLNSCQKEDSDNGSSMKVTITETGTGCTNIYAGQNILAGSVCLEDIDTDNDGNKDALKVTYATVDDWCIDEIHFDIGTNLSDIEMTKKGNLVPGQFPFKFENLGCVTYYTFNVPFSFWGFNCDANDLLYAAAHCVVKRPDGNGGFETQTGWGYGNNQPGNSWGTIFSFKIDCTEENPPQSGCETAWAYNQDGVNGSTRYCFLNLDKDDGAYAPNQTPSQNLNRWGWSNLIGPGEYSFQLWRGAGQCELGNGINVGTVSVSYDGNTAIVTYNTTGNYTLDEVHLYVGADILPDGNNGDVTVAPGQFPYNYGNLNGVTTKQITVNGLSGNIYVAAHAVVCNQ